MGFCVGDMVKVLVVVGSYVSLRDIRVTLLVPTVELRNPPGQTSTVSHWVFDAFRESAQTPGEPAFKVVVFVRKKCQVMFSSPLYRMVPIRVGFVGGTSVAGGGERRHVA